MALQKLIPPLIRLTTEVGEKIMQLYKSNIGVEIKPDKTPFTTADKIAHQLIVEGLTKLTPNIPILSEESENISFDIRRTWDEYWLVDPLDGTRDFLEQTGEFCICIAYIKNHTAILGMIYAPLTKTHYYAEYNKNAFKLHNNNTHKIHATKRSEVLRVVVGRHSSNNQKLQTLKQQNYQLFYLGSALKFCAIAEGLYDYYPRFGPCSEWDTAAGCCILISAGGKIVNEHNKPLRYNTQDDLTSSAFFAWGKS